MKVDFSREYPEGYVFPLTEPFAGQCAWFAGKITDMYPNRVFGVTLADKVRLFEVYLKQGFAKKSKPKVGNCVFFYEGRYGHIAVINEIYSNALRLTESNYIGRRKVSHQRTVLKRDRRIVGYYNTRPLEKFIEKEKYLAKFVFQQKKFRYGKPTFSVVFKNIGTETWKPSEVVLAVRHDIEVLKKNPIHTCSISDTKNPEWGSSVFYHPSWLTKYWTYSNFETVPPNQATEFWFKYNTLEKYLGKTGTVRQDFALSRDKKWIAGSNCWFEQNFDNL